MIGHSISKCVIENMPISISKNKTQVHGSLIWINNTLCRRLPNLPNEVRHHHHGPMHHRHHLQHLHHHQLAIVRHPMNDINAHHHYHHHLQLPLSFHLRHHHVYLIDLILHHSRSLRLLYHPHLMFVSESFSFGLNGEQV